MSSQADARAERLNQRTVLKANKSTSPPSQLGNEDGNNNKSTAPSESGNKDGSNNQQQQSPSTGNDGDAQAQLLSQNGQNDSEQWGTNDENGDNTNNNQVDTENDNGEINKTNDDDNDDVFQDAVGDNNNSNQADIGNDNDKNTWDETNNDNNDDISQNTIGDNNNNQTQPQQPQQSQQSHQSHHTNTTNPQQQQQQQQQHQQPMSQPTHQPQQQTNMSHTSQAGPQSQHVDDEPQPLHHVHKEHNTVNSDTKAPQSHHHQQQQQQQPQQSQPPTPSPTKKLSTNTTNSTSTATTVQHQSQQPPQQPIAIQTNNNFDNDDNSAPPSKKDPFFYFLLMNLDINDTNSPKLFEQMVPKLRKDLNQWQYHVEQVQGTQYMFQTALSLINTMNEEGKRKVAKTMKKLAQYIKEKTSFIDNDAFDPLLFEQSKHQYLWELMLTASLKIIQHANKNGQQQVTLQSLVSERKIINCTFIFDLVQKFLNADNNTTTTSPTNKTPTAPTTNQSYNNAAQDQQQQQQQQQQRHTNHQNKPINVFDQQTLQYKAQQYNNMEGKVTYNDNGELVFQTQSIGMIKANVKNPEYVAQVRNAATNVLTSNYNNTTCAALVACPVKAKDGKPITEITKLSTDSTILNCPESKPLVEDVITAVFVYDKEEGGKKVTINNNLGLDLTREIAYQLSTRKNKGETGIQHVTKILTNPPGGKNTLAARIYNIVCPKMDQFIQSRPKNKYVDLALVREDVAKAIVTTVGLIIKHQLGNQLLVKSVNSITSQQVIAEIISLVEKQKMAEQYNNTHNLTGNNRIRAKSIINFTPTNRSSAAKKFHQYVEAYKMGKLQKLQQYKLIIDIVNQRCESFEWYLSQQDPLYQPQWQKWSKSEQTKARQAKHQHKRHINTNNTGNRNNNNSHNNNNQQPHQRQQYLNQNGNNNNNNNHNNSNNNNNNNAQNMHINNQTSKANAQNQWGKPHNQ